MADEAPSPLKLAEDRVAAWINGTPVVQESSVLEQLIMFRQLKLLYPHQPTGIFELELSIKRELKKMKG